MVKTNLVINDALETLSLSYVTCILLIVIDQTCSEYTRGRPPGGPFFVLKPPSLLLLRRCYFPAFPAPFLDFGASVASASAPDCSFVLGTYLRTNFSLFLLDPLVEEVYFGSALRFDSCFSSSISSDSALVAPNPPIKL